jgi:hypothetical protein
MTEINYLWLYNDLVQKYNKTISIIKINGLLSGSQISDKYRKEQDELHEKYRNKPIPLDNLAYRNLYYEMLEKYEKVKIKCDTLGHGTYIVCSSCQGREDEEDRFTCSECNSVFCIKCESYPNNYNVPICFICYNCIIFSIDTTQIYDISKYKYSSNEMKNGMMTFLCCLNMPKYKVLKVPKFIKFEIIKFVSVNSETTDLPQYIKKSYSLSSWDINRKLHRVFDSIIDGFIIEKKSMLCLGKHDGLLHKLTKRQQILAKYMGFKYQGYNSTNL